MKHFFQHKKFLLNQPIKKLCPKVELIVLEDMLRRAEIGEDYELCTIILNRISCMKENETQDGS